MSMGWQWLNPRRPLQKVEGKGREGKECAILYGGDWSIDRNDPNPNAIMTYHLGRCFPALYFSIRPSAGHAHTSCLNILLLLVPASAHAGN